MEPESRRVNVVLEPALWMLAERLQKVVNLHMKELGKPELNLSGVLTLIIRTALLENADDVQDEFTELGLHRIAVRLAPLLGADVLEDAGFPDVPDSRRAHPSRLRGLETFFK